MVCVNTIAFMATYYDATPAAVESNILLITWVWLDQMFFFSVSFQSLTPCRIPRDMIVSVFDSSLSCSVFSTVLFEVHTRQFQRLRNMGLPQAHNAEYK